MKGSKDNKGEEEPRRQPYTAADLAQIHLGSGINIAAGIWLLIAPIYLGYAQPISRWNDIVVGLVLLVLAILQYTHPFHRFWIGWINAAIGLWLIAAPFVLKCDLMRAQINDIAVGIVVFLAGAISGSVRSYGR